MLRYAKLFVSLLNVVPRVLHTNAEKFGLILFLVNRLLVFDFATLNGEGAAPPVGNRHAQRGNTMARVWLLSRMLL